MLRDAGAEGDGIEDILTAPGLPQLCEELAGLAARRFDEAAKIMDAADRRAVRPARMMMAVYHRILVKLRRRGWHDLTRDVGPGKAEKIMIALRFGLFG
jgi:phytoene synthase